MLGTSFFAVWVQGMLWYNTSCRYRRTSNIDIAGEDEVKTVLCVLVYSKTGNQYVQPAAASVLDLEGGTNRIRMQDDLTVKQSRCRCPVSIIRRSRQSATRSIERRRLLPTRYYCKHSSDTRTVL